MMSLLSTVHYRQSRHHVDRINSDVREDHVWITADFVTLQMIVVITVMSYNVLVIHHVVLLTSRSVIGLKTTAISLIGPDEMLQHLLNELDLQETILLV